MTRTKIGTHDGTFHCDEVLACAMLKMLPEYEDAEVVRSREDDVLDACDIVVDVGEVFDHGRKRYDHHQRTFNESMKTLSQGKMKNLTKLSSAGLVYFYYGKTIICEVLDIDPETDKTQLDYIFEHFYDEFIQEIDEIDNYSQLDYKPSTTCLTSRVAHCRPDWDDENQDFDQGFQKASEMVKREFEDYLQKAKSDWRARSALKQKLLERHSVHKSGRVIFLERWIDWKPNLKNLQEELGIQKKIYYIVTYDPDHDCYGIKCCNSKDTFFPRAWRGRSNKELEQVSGISGAKFVHATGFHANSKTKDSAFEMINNAMRKV